VMAAHDDDDGRSANRRRRRVSAARCQSSLCLCSVDALPGILIFFLYPTAARACGAPGWRACCPPGRLYIGSTDRRTAQHKGGSRHGRDEVVRPGASPRSFDAPAASVPARTRSTKSPAARPRSDVVSLSLCVLFCVVVELSVHTSLRRARYVAKPEDHCSKKRRDSAF